VIGDEVRARAGNERSQPLQEDERLEDHMRSSVAPRPTEAVQDVAMLGEREPFRRNGGTIPFEPALEAS
jgi:hypothetical protein